MKNLIICVVAIAATLFSLNVNAQVISESSTACTSGQDINYSCGSVTLELPSGEAFSVTDATPTTLLVQDVSGEFNQINGNFELFNDNDHIAAGMSAISGAGAWFAEDDEMYFSGVADFSPIMGGDTIAIVSYQNSTSSEVYSCNATQNSAEVSYRNLSTGDAVQLEVNSTTIETSGGDVHINSGGGEYDFRVDGNSDPHLLFVDASTNNVGIGTNTPTSTLQVEGQVTFNDAGGEIDFRVEGGTDANLLFTDGSADNVGIGTNAPSEKLDVNGNARIRSVASGPYNTDIGISATGVLQTASSDKRMKYDIENLEGALNKVLQLNGVSFYWENAPKRTYKDIGFIAQEVEEIFPELVFTNPVDGYMGINYSRFPAILAEAIEEQQAIIEEKDARIEILEDKVAKQDERLARLEAMLLDNDGNSKPGNSGLKPGLSGDMGTLGQNQPNPFANSTTIFYTLNEASNNAYISVMNISGKELMTKRLESSEQGQVEISLNQLGSGIYFYSLVVDGNIVATKPMVKM